MSLRRGVWAVLIVVAVLFVAAGGLIAAEVATARDAQSQLQSRYNPAVQRTEALLLDYVNQETGYRGYLLTAEDSFLVPYTTGLTAATKDSTRLRTLFAGDGNLLAQLDDVLAAAKTWDDEIVPTLALRRAGDTAGAISRLTSATAKNEFDLVRNKLTTLQASVTTARDQAETRQRHAAELLIAALVVASIVALAAVLLLAVLARRWVTRPIGRLSVAAQGVRDGTLDEAVRLDDGPPELIRLAEAVDAMRVRLVALVRLAGRASDTALEAREAEVLAREEAVQATEALNQRAPVVTAVSEALQASAPTIEGLDVDGVIAMAEGHIAGDWWDCIMLADGRAAVVLADISGHGASAGFQAVRLKAVLMTGLRLGHDPVQLFATAATEVFGSHDDMFATAVLLLFDRSTLTWINAGHPAPVVFRASGERVHLEPTGPMVHRMFDTWTDRSIPFALGDLVIAYTDGIVESRNERDETLDIATALTAAAGEATAAATTASLVDSLTAHLGGPRARDDVTVVAVRRTPATPGNASPTPAPRTAPAL